MKKRHRLSLRILVVLFALVFLAISVGAFAAPKKTLKLAEIFLADAGNKVQYNMIMAAYKKFEELNNCKLDIVSYSWDDLPNQLQIMGAAKKLPDVSYYWFANVGPLFIENGWLEKLDPYIQKDKDFKAGNIDMITKYKDGTYGVATGTADMALFVNKTLLQQNGFSKPPQTWDELQQMCKKVTDPANGVYGIALNGGDEESLLVLSTFIAQNGGHVGLYKGKMGINSPEAVEAVQFVVDLINDGVVPGFVSSGFKQARDIFNSGKAAFLIDGSWNLKYIMPKETDFVWTTAMLPKGKTNGTAWPIGDSAYSIFSTSKEKQLAWEFIKYMASEAVLKQVSESRVAYPTVSVSVNSSQLANITYGKYIKGFYEQLKAGNILDIYGEMPPQLQFSFASWKTELHKAVLGEKSVQQAMDAVASDWTKLMADWEKQYGKYSKVPLEVKWDY